MARATLLLFDGGRAKSFVLCFAAVWQRGGSRMKAVIVVLLLLVAAIVGIGFTLKPHWAVERSTVVNAPPERIYPYVSTLRRWPEWTPWIQRDPTFTSSYDGP